MRHVRSAVYQDRRAGGSALAALLAAETSPPPVVLGLPRGGVPVAAVVAAALGAPLDVLVVRKIGAPGRPELGLGAVAEDGEPVWDAEGLHALGLVPADLAGTAAAEAVEVRRRIERYRRGAPAIPLAGRTAIVVDDGVATGGTALAALRLVRRHAPARLVLAAPVGAPAALARLEPHADEVFCPLAPAGFRAVGVWYADFDQTSDGEVETHLAEAAGRRRS